MAKYFPSHMTLEEVTLFFPQVMNLFKNQSRKGCNFSETCLETLLLNILTQINIPQAKLVSYGRRNCHGNECSYAYYVWWCKFSPKKYVMDA